jgi:ribosomal protein S8E
VLYAFSVGNEIWLILNHRKMMSLKQVVDNPASSNLDQLNTSERDTEIIVKVYKGAGRTISFKEEVNSGE